MTERNRIIEIIRAQEAEARDSATCATTEINAEQRAFLRGLAQGKRDVCAALRRSKPAYWWIGYPGPRK